jgi:hypothetical protein
MAGTITGQEVFETAMSLLDELSSAGLADTSDTAEYKNRSLAILNLLQIELYPYSDTYAVATAGTRPIPTRITSLANAITNIDDNLALGVMPYGLAGKLLAGEGDSRGNYYLETYAELKRQISTAPAEFAAIENVYGVMSDDGMPIFEHSEFGSW